MSTLKNIKDSDAKDKKESEKSAVEKIIEENIDNGMENGKELVVAVLDKMNTLFTSGMGLVAALAWNEAIKDLFDKIFGQQDANSLWARFGYAAVITIIVVMVTFRLTRLLEKIKKKGKVNEDVKKDRSDEV